MRSKHGRLSGAAKLGAGLLAAAVVGAGASVVVGTPAPAPMAPPSSTVVTVIDISRVLQGLKEREARDQELQASERELTTKASDLKKEIEADRASLESLPDTADKLAAARRLREKMFRADFELDFSKAVLGEKQAEGMKELHAKIVDAAGRLAKARGYHLVLSSDMAVPVRGNMDELSRTISLKRFVYVDAQLDITDELIAFMNNEYAVGSKK